jgi:hypothetical protein
MSFFWLLSPRWLSHPRCLYNKVRYRGDMKSEQWICPGWQHQIVHKFIQVTAVARQMTVSTTRHLQLRGVPRCSRLRVATMSTRLVGFVSLHQNESQRRQTLMALSTEMVFVHLSTIDKNSFGHEASK